MTHDALRPFLLVAVVAAAYLNALRADFQFDDYNVIVQNPVVQSWPAWWSDFPRGIRPLLKASYALNWTLGPGAFGFHLLNVLVHGLNTLLVYALSKAVVKQTCPGSSLTWAPMLTTLLFALHPIQTEAVTYISGRSMSLMTLLYLGSLLAYVHGRDLLSLALFLLALLVKEVAVTLPAALLLWEWVIRADHLTVRRPDWAPWRAILRRQARHWGVLGAAVIFLAWHPGYHSLLAYSFSLRSLHDAALTQIHGIAYLLSQLVWVHHLNIDPDLPIVSHWTPALAAEFLFLATCLGVGVASVRRCPWLAFGILWLFLHLLPTNSFVPRLDVANERQLYLAGWGVFLTLGVGVVRLSQTARWPALVPALSVLLAVLLGTATVLRNEAYRTEVALWEATVRESPGKARAHNNLGYAYSLAGRQDEAREAYQAALRLDPEFALARQNLAALRGK